MASAIGGDHAMSVIANCASTRGRVVRDEVDRAWSKFEPEEFARRVLAKWEHIRIDDPTLLPALKNLRVQGLTCRFSHGYGNIDYVRGIPELRNFTLLDSKLSSLAPLAEHPNLEMLHLYEGTRPVDISPLDTCRSLEIIDLPFGSVADPRQLRGLVHVRDLQFTDRAPILEIMDNLAEDLKLRRLGMWQARSMTGLDSLLEARQLENLEFLLLGNARHLRSIAGIERWAGTVKGIFLDARELTDIDRISSLPLLNFANLKNTPITSLEFLSGNSQLARLHIGGTGRIPDLAPLCDIRALCNLHIRGEGPVDVSGLAGATDLVVHIDGNTRRPVRGREKLPASVVVRRNVMA
jgi:hypothetical protein